jgi:alpha-L-fucosidase
MDDYIDKIALPQIAELLTKYGPDTPAVIWWDTPVDMNAERAGKINSLVQKLRPGIIMNNRLGGDFQGDTDTPEQSIPSGGYPGRDWETCMTLNDTWGYRSDDQNFKSVDTLIHNLCDIASKGGNYLLNVGPTSEGLIPEPEVERLKAVGAWMKVNGDAIYGTTATPFASVSAPPTGSPEVGWRATKKPGHVYLIIFDWPGNGSFIVPAFSKKLLGATLLADHSAKLTVRQDEKGTTVSGLPTPAPDRIASVIDMAY